MANPFTTPGMFSWTELLTCDPMAAKSFYGPVFGWQFKEDLGPTGPYTEIVVAGRSIGGIQPIPRGCPTPPSWSNYVTVADIAKVIEQAPALGGGVAFGPKDVPGVGRIAVIRDGQGASFAPIQYAMKTPPSGERPNPRVTPGGFGWVELMTNDRTAARAFYGKLLGWTFEKAGDFDYEIIKINGQMVGGLMPMPPGCPPSVPPCWGVYVTVTDTDQACAKAKSSGGKVIVEPEDVPTVGRFAVIQDPQGAAISMMKWAM